MRAQLHGSSHLATDEQLDNRELIMRISKALYRHVFCWVAGSACAFHMTAALATVPSAELPPSAGASLPESAVLRSTTNGSYSARLVFQPQRLAYVVELYHQSDLWRSVQTDVVKDAEATYEAFSRQTADLAQVEIDAMRLSAGKQYAEHMVQLNSQRLQGLRADLEHQQRESQQVLAQQTQTKQQAQALSGDLRSVSARLDQVQQDIRRLEAIKANPSLPLAQPDAADAPSPAAGDPAAGGAP